MLNTICICCAGRMVTPGVRNPNLCAACEQLLEDDCAALDTLMPDVKPRDGVCPPSPRGRPATDPEPHHSAAHSEF
jgi:hypothetical protein